MSENDAMLNPAVTNATEKASAEDINQTDNEKEYNIKLKANNTHSDHNDDADDIDHDDHDKSHSENQDHPARKHTWSIEEDKKLRLLVDTHGTNKWNQLAAMVPDRSGKQLRERWHNHLNPNIKKGEWSQEDDEMIVNMQGMLGNQWAKIAKMLSFCRTDNAVKNRFHALKRYQNSVYQKKPRSSSFGNKSDSDNENNYDNIRNGNNTTTVTTATTTTTGVPSLLPLPSMGGLASTYGGVTTSSYNNSPTNSSRINNNGEKNNYEQYNMSIQGGYLQQSTHTQDYKNTYQTSHSTATANKSSNLLEQFSRPDFHHLGISNYDKSSVNHMNHINIGSNHIYDNAVMNHNPITSYSLLNKQNHSKNYSEHHDTYLPSASHIYNDENDDMNNSNHEMYLTGKMTNNTTTILPPLKGHLKEHSIHGHMSNLLPLPQFSRSGQLIKPKKILNTYNYSNSDNPSLFSINQSLTSVDHLIPPSMGQSRYSYGSDSMIESHSLPVPHLPSGGPVTPVNITPVMMSDSSHDSKHNINHKSTLTGVTGPLLPNAIFNQKNKKRQYDDINENVLEQDYDCNININTNNTFTLHSPDKIKSQPSSPNKNKIIKGNTKSQIQDHSMISPNIEQIHEKLPDGLHYMPSPRGMAMAQFLSQKLSTKVTDELQLDHSTTNDTKLSINNLTRLLDAFESDNNNNNNNNNNNDNSFDKNLFQSVLSKTTTIPIKKLDYKVTNNYFVIKNNNDNDANNEDDEHYEIVFCINSALNLHTSHIASHCCTATVGIYELAANYCSTGLINWKNQHTDDIQSKHMGKLCYRVASDFLMTHIETIAHEHGILTYMTKSIIVTDEKNLVNKINIDTGNGKNKTQIQNNNQDNTNNNNNNNNNLTRSGSGGSTAVNVNTVLAIGPAPISVLQNILKNLTLME